MPGQPSRAAVIAAFAAVYVIWGSTYLAILFAIETLPPFLMAAVRFLVAGGIMMLWSKRGGARWPTRAEWRGAAIVGALLLVLGNGGVVWAEQTVPSGIAALLIAVTPCWMVLLDWLWARSARPRIITVAGLVLGFAGIALLIGPGLLAGRDAVDPIGAAVLMIASFSWATGSIYSRRAPRAPGAFSTAMQMLCGGALLLVLGLVTGEAGRVEVDAISGRSAAALLYLIVFGSIIGYSAYVWLLRVVSPARVATYAYVNPVVAVLLGWAFAGEALTLRMGLAALIIICGVALITIDQQARTAGTGAVPNASGAAVADTAENA